MNEDITPYMVIGEEEGLKKLVSRFYFHMDNNPNAKNCRDLHKDDLTEASSKLFDFLSGWLGGPPLYIQKYGHPMMRKRHFPFKVGFKERDEWLLCMRLALDELNLETEFDASLFTAFQRFAEHMRNRD